MNKLKIIIISGVCFIFCFLGCNEDKMCFPEMNTLMSEISECKTTELKSESVELVQLKALGSNLLSIKHLNSDFNCCPGDLDFQLEFINNLILLNETSTKDDCHCICPYDFTFTVGPLTSSQYQLRILKNGNEYFDLSFEYTDKLDQSIIIN